MSTGNNPVGRAVDAYVKLLLEHLGSRDPLDVLAELPTWMETRLNGHPQEALRKEEAPGKWSVVAVVAHLADSELVSGWRTRMIAAENEPRIPAYDQDAWAIAFGYLEADLDAALDQLLAMRTANLRFWRLLTPTQLARRGIHSERGPETLGHVLRLLAGHDLVHRNQIDRILRVGAA